MSGIVSLLNQNSNEYVLANDLAEIKYLLSLINSAVGGVVEADNLFLMYPVSTADKEISAGATVTEEIAVNRKLKQMCVSVPEGVVLQIQNDNSVFAWFEDESGTFDFDTGITFGTLKVICTNTTSDSQRWTCKLSFK